MSRDWDEKVDWQDQILFNDPRQLSMSFIESPGDEFHIFHSKNPWVWRQFRTSVLEAINSGQKKVNAAEILKKVINGVVLRDDLVRQYKELFVSNHQELENVFIDETVKESKQKS